MFSPEFDERAISAQLRRLAPTQLTPTQWQIVIFEYKHIEIQLRWLLDTVRGSSGYWVGERVLLGG